MNGERSDEQLGRDSIISWRRYSWSRWATVRSCVFGSSNDRPLTRRTKHLHVTRLTRLEFKPGAYNTVQAYLKHGLQIGPMRRHTLHFLFLVSYPVLVSSYTFFSLLTCPLRFLGAIISNASLLYEMLSIPMTQGCRVLHFKILCLFTTKSPTCFPFLLRT